MAIHEITPEGEHDIPFDPDAFDTLLDSPSAAGAPVRAASRRDHGPGRRRPALLPEGRPKLRLALLTSMFSFGANQRSPREDCRPQGGRGFTRSVRMYHTELVLLGARQPPMRCQVVLASRHFRG